MSTKKKPQPQQAPKGAGPINIDTIVEKEVRAKIPTNLQAMYDKVVLSGMRIMFDKNSHAMALQELDAEGPMPQKLAEGVIKLMYMLWTESNQSIPPQIVVPVTLTLTLRAFQFLQMAQDPEATKEVMGEATALAVQGVMDRFGATQDKLPALLKSQGGNAQPQQAGGMLAAGGK
jgi:hypothetical protein